MQTGHNGARALGGPGLAIAGGCLLAVGALMPWLDVTYALPNGNGTFVESGWDRPEGKIAFMAGVVMAVAGIIMTGDASARRAGAISAAAAIVVAVAVLGDLWGRLSVNGGTGYGVPVSSAGVLVGLAGVLLSFHGTRGQRAVLLALMFGASLCGVAFVLLVDNGPLFGSF